MTNLIMVCFDVSEPRRLRRVSNELENFGVRVQRSIFECHLEDAELNTLKKRLQQLIDETADQVRYYPLCDKDQPGILIDGAGESSRDPDYHLL